MVQIQWDFFIQLFYTPVTYGVYRKTDGTGDIYMKENKLDYFVRGSVGMAFPMWRAWV